MSYDALASGRAIYAYVGGDPVSNTDPSGLDWHHVFPRANWPGYSQAAQDVFDNYDSQARTPKKHGFSKGHFAYNQATKELGERFCRATNITPNQMAAQDAKNLIEVIEGSQDPRIRDFLAAETGINPQSGFIAPQMIESMSAWAFFITILTHSQSVW